MVEANPSGRMPVLQDAEDAAFFEDFGPPDEVRDKPDAPSTRPFEMPDDFVFRNVHTPFTSFGSIHDASDVKQARKWLDEFQASHVLSFPNPIKLPNTTTKQASEVKTVYIDLCGHEHKDGSITSLAERDAGASAINLATGTTSSVSESTTLGPLSSSTSDTAASTAVTLVAALGLENAEFKQDALESGNSFTFESGTDSKRRAEDDVASIQILTWSELSVEGMSQRSLDGEVKFLTDFILDLKDAEAKEYICHICSELMSEPVDAGKCGHAFCKICLEKWYKDAPRGDGSPSCPGCRAKLRKPPYRDNSFLELRTNGIEAICGLEKCTWKGAKKVWFKHRTDECLQTKFKCAWCDYVAIREQIPIHEKSCQLRWVTCDECGTRVRQNDMNVVHVYEKCQGVLVKCNRICGIKVKRVHMTHHLEKECVLRPVACRYSNIGCTFKDVPNTMRLHEAQLNVHFRLALEFIKNVHDMKVALYPSFQDYVNDLVIKPAKEVVYDSQWSKTHAPYTTDYYHRPTCENAAQVYSPTRSLFDVLRMYKIDIETGYPVYMRPCPNCRPLGATYRAD